MVVGEETETTRSRARRYAGRKRYRRLGSSTSSAKRCIVCGGFFLKLVERVCRMEL